MHAILRRHAPRPDVATFDIAGRPLVIRQLQWLRAIGCTTIVVEIGDDAVSERIAQIIEERDAAGSGVFVTAAAASAREVALRAGVPREAPLLVLDGDTIGVADPKSLFAMGGDVAAAFDAPPPAIAELERGGMEVIRGHGSGAPSDTSIASWAVRIRSPRDAWLLGCAVLSHSADGGAFPLMVHGFERSPGIWLARGAHVERGAVLVAPVFLGASVEVLDGAIVGPGAIVGERVILGDGVRVTDSVIEPETLVAEGLVLARCIAGPGRLSEWEGEDDFDVDGELLGTVSNRAVVPLASRGIALGCLLALAPLLPAALVSKRAKGVLGALTEVARGSRYLVGVTRDLDPDEISEAPSMLVANAERCPRGAFDIESRLSPDDADGETVLRARAWYAGAKSPLVDLKLLFQRRMGAA
ncbi:hypothetical protein BH09MYX1_BH09MYX1_24190 [soil metagenome]